MLRLCPSIICSIEFSITIYDIRKSCVESRRCTEKCLFNYRIKICYWCYIHTSCFFQLLQCVVLVQILLRCECQGYGNCPIIECGSNCLHRSGHTHMNYPVRSRMRKIFYSTLTGNNENTCHVIRCVVVGWLVGSSPTSCCTTAKTAAAANIIIMLNIISWRRLRSTPNPPHLILPTTIVVLTRPTNMQGQKVANIYTSRTN